MSKVVEAQVTCDKCGHVFDTHIWTSLNTHGPQKWLDSFFNKTLFDVKCPACKETIHLHYNMLYHDMDHSALVWYTPDNSSESLADLETGLEMFRQLGAYQARIVFSQDHLVEKAKIFHEGLDDRIVELLKVFSVDNLSAEIDGFEFQDGFFDIKGDEKHFIIFSKTDAFRCTFLNGFYNEIKEFALDLIEKASANVRIIDYDWADQLSYSVLDILPQSDEDQKGSIYEIPNYICQECGLKFGMENGRMFLNDDAESDLLKSFYDFSLFHQVCPACGSQALLFDHFTYFSDADKTIILFLPNDIPNRLKRLNRFLDEFCIFDDYSIRLVDSIESLVEKAKILRAGLDDRIIEFIKVEASQFEMTVRDNAPEDFFKDSFFDGNREFAVLKFDESLRYGINFSIERYDYLEETFSDTFDLFSENSIIIDYEWAKKVQSYLVLEADEKNSIEKIINLFTFDDLQEDNNDYVDNQLGTIDVVLDSDPSIKELYEKFKPYKANTPEEKLLIAIFEDQEKKDLDLLARYYECKMINDFSTFKKFELDMARELVDSGRYDHFGEEQK